jgi:hypothetical protein
MELELTQEETDLFGLLMAVVAESDCRTVVRVAGGWVRDKVSTPPPFFFFLLLFFIEVPNKQPNSCWASGTEAVTLTWSWTTCQLWPLPTCSRATDRRVRVLRIQCPHH